MNHIACHALLLLLVNIVVSKEATTVTFCEKNLSEQCLIKITKRSIDQPITSMLEYQEKSMEITPKVWSIQCDSDLVLDISKATISNVDKSKCPAQMSNEQDHFETIISSGNCTDSLQTKILVSNLCNGKNQCKISLETGKFSKLCECSTEKYLSVSYTCIQPINVRKKRAGTQFNLDKYYGKGYGGVKQYNGESDLSSVRTLKNDDRRHVDSQYESQFSGRRSDDRYDDRRSGKRYGYRRRYNDDYYYDDYYYNDYYYNDYYYDDYYYGDYYYDYNYDYYDYYYPL